MPGVSTASTLLQVIPIGVSRCNVPRSPNPHGHLGRVLAVPSVFPEHGQPSESVAGFAAFARLSKQAVQPFLNASILRACSVERPGLLGALHGCVALLAGPNTCNRREYDRVEGHASAPYRTRA